MIEELREKIKDYYGSAMQIYPNVIADYSDVDLLSDEEVVELAKKLHSI